MGNRDFSSIDGALASVWENDVANQINRAVVALQLLPCMQTEGKNVTWDVRVGTATPTTAAIADGADVSTYNVDTKVAATLNVTTYHDAFTVTGLALAAAQASGNPMQLQNLFRDEMTDSIQRLASAIGTDFYVGTGSSNKMLGILDSTAGGIIDTGTYANVSRGTYAQWKGNVVDAATGALSFTNIRDLRRKIYTASGRRVDLYITDPVQHEKLGLLYGAYRRYVDTVTVRGQSIKLDGGYQVLEMDGVPVIEDVLCPAQTFIGLNTSEVRMRYLPPVNAAITGAMGDVPLAGTAEEQYGVGAVKLMGRINPLARTGDAYKFQVLVYVTPQVRSPNTCGYIKNLAP